MRKYITIFLACFIAVSVSSCLKHGLEDLDEYSGCDVTNGDVYWRYFGDNVIPVSGEREVKQVRLAAARSQDVENNTYTIRYSTNNIPEAERGNFTESKAVVILTISTASTIKPIGDAPALGVPGDWSKDNKYEVTAADGTKKVWTIVVEPYQ
ncbi:MAG: hypothetical protein PUK70_05405 [Bacteroidales bacterium]|nr:hypothetical protein [Bacteroidales bacterium]MDY6002075.1 hypothetical protein [Candidatus Cryptobacteroides sp.]